MRGAASSASGFDDRIGFKSLWTSLRIQAKNKDDASEIIRPQALIHARKALQQALPDICCNQHACMTAPFLLHTSDRQSWLGPSMCRGQIRGRVEEWAGEWSGLVHGCRRLHLLWLLAGWPHAWRRGELSASFGQYAACLSALSCPQSGGGQLQWE